MELIGPDDASFAQALESLLGREPDEVLRPALRFSVIARNGHTRAVALLGVRFDMATPAKSYSVVHYADTLRYPEKAELQPGALRFVCAEPLYTDLVLRRARDIDPRGPMSLRNLRRATRAGASIDCVAFDNGEFAGPDSLGAWARFGIERAAEIAFRDEVLAATAGPAAAVEALLEEAAELPGARDGDRAAIARRMLARRLREALAAGGMAGMADRARRHRPRIALWRASEAGPS